MTSVNTYIRKKAEYICNMDVRDNGVLKRRLLNTLIGTYAQALNWTGKEIEEANAIVDEVAKEHVVNDKNLPHDWKEVIKNHKRPLSWKNYTPKEALYHREFCSKSSCAFGFDHCCPVVLWGGNNEK